MHSWLIYFLFLFPEPNNNIYLQHDIIGFIIYKIQKEQEKNLVGGKATQIEVYELFGLDNLARPTWICVKLQSNHYCLMNSLFQSIIQFSN